MKRLVFLLTSILLLSACSVAENEPTIPEGNYTHGIYELTFKTRKISNNYVGNDWSVTYSYKGQTITSGYQVAYALDLFTFLPVHVEIREDDKIDDVGTGTLRIALADGGSGKTEITVTEKGGKFEGNTAIWEVSCDVKLIGKQ